MISLVTEPKAYGDTFIGEQAKTKSIEQFYIIPAERKNFHITTLFALKTFMWQPCLRKISFILHNNQINSCIHTKFFLFMRTAEQTNMNNLSYLD